jgi:hypothetical protein
VPRSGGGTAQPGFPGALPSGRAASGYATLWKPNTPIAFSPINTPIIATRTIALGREAILARYTVQFTTATTLVAGLAKAHGERRLGEKLLALSKPKLLIVDELGY